MSYYTTSLVREIKYGFDCSLRTIMSTPTGNAKSKWRSVFVNWNRACCNDTANIYVTKMTKSYFLQNWFSTMSCWLAVKTLYKHFHWARQEAQICRIYPWSWFATFLRGNLGKGDEYFSRVHAEDKGNAVEPYPFWWRCQINDAMNEVKLRTFICINESMRWLGISTSPLCPFISSILQ